MKDGLKIVCEFFNVHRDNCGFDICTVECAFGETCAPDRGCYLDWSGDPDYQAV